MDERRVMNVAMRAYKSLKRQRCEAASSPVDLAPMLLVFWATDEYSLLQDPPMNDLHLHVAVIENLEHQRARALVVVADAVHKNYDPRDPEQLAAAEAHQPGDVRAAWQAGDSGVKECLDAVLVSRAGSVRLATLDYTVAPDGVITWGDLKHSSQGVGGDVVIAMKKAMLT